MKISNNGITLRPVPLGRYKKTGLEGLLNDLDCGKRRCAARKPEGRRLQGWIGTSVQNYWLKGVCLQCAKIVEREEN